MTVIHVAAEITRALVGLDRRYARIPGWRQLKDPGRLGRAAEVCAAYSGYGDPRLLRRPTRAGSHPHG